MQPRIRAATAADAARCAAVYAPYVTDTVISFETEPPTPAQMAERIAAARAWLVAVVDDRVVGYAYAGEHRSRAAYRWSVDVSAYLEVSYHRRGLGTRLYTALLERLRGRGFHLACAGVTEPNPASAALHERLGFTRVGTYTEVGWKHGAWRDVTWYQLRLGPGGPPRGERAAADAGAGPLGR